MTSPTRLLPTWLVPVREPRTLVSVCVDALLAISLLSIAVGVFVTHAYSVAMFGAWAVMILAGVRIGYSTGWRASSSAAVARFAQEHRARD